MPSTLGIVSSSYKSPWGPWGPPPTTNGLRVWLDGKDETTMLKSNGTQSLPGEQVATWVDKSGNGVNFVGTNAQNNAGVLLSTTASNLNAGRQTWFETSFDPFTLFFVIQSTNNFQKNLFYAGSKYIRVGFNSVYGNAISLHQTNGDSLSDTAGNTTNLTRSIIVAEYYTAKLAKIKVLKNNQTTSNEKTWVTNWPNATNAMQFGNASWTGYVKELLIYTRNLTTNELQDTIINLNNKWQVNSIYP